MILSTHPKRAVGYATGLWLAKAPIRFVRQIAPCKSLLLIIKHRTIRFAWLADQPGVLEGVVNRRSSRGRALVRLSLLLRKRKSLGMQWYIPREPRWLGSLLRLCSAWVVGGWVPPEVVLVHGPAGRLCVYVCVRCDSRCTGGPLFWFLGGEEGRCCLFMFCFCDFVDLCRVAVFCVVFSCCHVFMSSCFCILVFFMFSCFCFVFLCSCVYRVVLCFYLVMLYKFVRY